MPHSILIIDDDETIRNGSCEFLEYYGYEVRAAASAEEALQIFKSFQPEVVLTDIILDGMDGLELTKQIKASYESDVIVMTGYSADYSYEKAVTAGASDFIFKPFRFEEMDLRIKRVLKERQLKIEHSRALKKLEELAITDALTKLYNSRHFFHQLKIEIDRHKRYGRSLSLLIIDVDNFKTYNDTYGHLEGDKVLMKMGEIIASCLRINDTAYRYGGDEFMVILPETGLKKACVVGERIRNEFISQKFYPEKHKPVTVTTSIGVTELTEEESLENFVKKADLALYKSKEAGRNQVSCLLNTGACPS